MKFPEFSILVFISGCIGAAAPEIIRLNKIKHKLTFKFSKTTIIISMLFSSLGGFVAWILPTTSLWGAFYVGVSLPVIVSSIGKSKILSEVSPVQVSSPIKQFPGIKPIHAGSSGQKSVLSKGPKQPAAIAPDKPGHKSPLFVGPGVGASGATLSPEMQKQKAHLRTGFINTIRDYLGALYL